MALAKDSQQPQSKKLNNIKSKTKNNIKSKTKLKPTNKLKYQLSDSDKKLMLDFLESKKHLANPQTKKRTEAITTDGIVRDILGIDPESNTGNIRGVVSAYIKSLDGWLNKQKRVNGNPARIWIFESSSKKGVTVAKKLDSNSLQETYHPLKKETKSLDISTCSDEPKIEQKVVKELANRYLPYGEEDIKFVRDTLLTHVLSDTKLDLAGVYEEWESQFSLEIFEKACKTIPTVTVNMIQELVPQVQAALRSKRI